MNTLELKMPLVVQERIGSEAWDIINKVDVALAKLPQQDIPLDHVFCKNQYVRTVFMPAGSLLTTRIHLTEHPYFILSGVVSIWEGDKGSVTLRAPFIGVTKPGTRRVLFVHEDCIFSTAHVTNETDTEKLVDLLTFDPVDLGHLDGLSAEQLAVIRGAAKEKVK